MIENKINMLDKNDNLYKNKYNLESTRLQNWDYSWSGYYFITICTKEKKHFFGTVEAGKIILNEMGKIAEKFWLEIPAHFSNVTLDKFVIMPNHMHGILIIDKNKDNNINIGINRFQNQGKNSISSIIGSYKSICTKNINKTQNEVFFAWQTRFHDHIIRDKKALDNIRKYIENNPLNWENDSYNKV